MTSLHLVYSSMLSDAGSVEIPELLLDFAGKPEFSRCKDKEAKVVKRPLREREVAGSKPGRAILKALKMVPVANLLGAQHYKASTGFCHSLLTQLTLHKKKNN